MDPPTRPGASLRTRWLAWRNRRLASPAFQRWALDFPLTRPVARREAAALFDTVAGFVYAQVLAAFVELELPRLLAGPPLSLGELAAATRLPEPAALRLLRAAAALRLAEAVGPAHWTLGPRGAALIGNPGVGEMIAHHAMLYRDLAEPVALLRRGGGGGALAAHWPYAGAAVPANSEAVADYSALMAASQPLVARQLLDAYDFTRHQHLIDVGGGDGAFVEAVAARAPELMLTVCDLAPTASRARARLGGRASIVSLDFRREPLPAGADLMTLVRVLHDHDDPAAEALLGSAHRALAPGGTLIVAEPMAGTRGARAMGDAYFGFYLLAMGAGRPRSASEIKALLTRAGFAPPRERPTRNPLVVRIIVARKAG